MLRHPLAVISILDVLCAVAFVICLLVAVYYQGKRVERRQASGARRPLHLPGSGQKRRLDVFIPAPRGPLDLRHASTPAHWLFVDRPLS